MGILDFIIIGIVAVAFIVALRFMKKNGSGCGGCSGDCMRCSKQKK